MAPYTVGCMCFIYPSARSLMSPVGHGTQRFPRAATHSSIERAVMIAPLFDHCDTSTTIKDNFGDKHDDRGGGRT